MRSDRCVVLIFFFLTDDWKGWTYRERGIHVLPREVKGVRGCTGTGGSTGSVLRLPVTSGEGGGTELWYRTVQMEDVHRFLVVKETKDGT